MAILALAAAGAMAGSALASSGIIAASYLGMSAGSLGWMAGSMLGNALFAEKQSLPGVSGPRLGDLKVSDSANGNVIPFGYGTFRLKGDPIWSSDIIETAHVTQVSSGGGKGGGGGSTQTQTTYSYSVHLAVGVHDGLIAGIRRIWANGKLIYNVGAAADLQSVIAANQRAGNIRFYLGTTTQVADSLIESYQGAGNVPGYRSLAYVLFQDLALADFGNRIPSLEFEVCGSATAGFAVNTTESAWHPGNGTDTGTGFPSIWSTGGSYDGINSGQVTPGHQGTVFHWHNGYIRDGVLDVYKVAYDSPNVKGVGRDRFILGQARVRNEELAWQPNLTSLGTGIWTTPGWAKSTEASIVFARQTSSPIKRKYVSFTRQMEIQLPDRTGLRLFTQYGNDVYIGSIGGAGELIIEYFSLAALVGSTTVLTTVNMAPASQSYIITASANYWWLIYGRSGASTIINKYDRATSTLVATWAIADQALGSGDEFGGLHVLDEARNILLVDCIFSGASGTVYKIEAGVVSSYGTLVGYAGLFNAMSAMSEDGNTLFKMTDNGGGVLMIPRWFTNRITPSAPTVASAVTDLCSRAGLAAGDIDVSTLTDSLQGYVIGTRGPVRSMIEPLMTAFFFDATESDNQIKFVKRGGATAYTILEDDLAAHEWGTEPPDPIEHTRRHELDLPVQADIVYMSQEADYEQGKQTARRLVTSSKQVSTFQLPIVLADAAAKKIVDVALYDAWISRDRHKIRVSRKYARAEPTDILVIGDRAVRVRIEGKHEGAPGILELDCALDDASIYTQSAAAASGPAPSQTISVPGPTLIEFMDIPIVRDQDDNAGFYIATCGYLSGWTGQQLFVSKDGGETWDDVEAGLTLTAAAMGACDDALATFTRNEVFDEGGSVTVTLVAGTLASVSRTQIFNGSNVAVIGSELVQFRTATLVGTKQYTLTGLLRGRRGTEWAMGGHAAGERFVLLATASARRIVQSSGELGAARKWKPVSLGYTLAQTETRDFTNTGIGLKPYAPVQVGAGRNVALDVLLKWRRRSRLDSTWRNYVDAPLGEATESYEIDIMNGAAVVRTLTASTNTVTYTVAQQSTDFGGAQASLTVKVYQLSTTFGRGYAATATV